MGENKLLSSFSGSLSTFSEGVQQNVRVFLVEKTDSWLGLAEHVSDGSFVEWNDNWSLVGLDPSFEASVSLFVDCRLIERSEDFNASFWLSDLSDVVS